MCFAELVYICSYVLHYIVFFFFKQKTAYEMRISDWSSDVCSSDLIARNGEIAATHRTTLEADLITGAVFVAEQHLHRTWRAWIGQKIGRASCRERVCQYV